MRGTLLLPLLIACASTRDGSPIEGAMAPSEGSQSWDPVTAEGCTEWALIPDAWGASLERRWQDRGECPLSGAVWWEDPVTDQGCAEWTFVPHDWGVSLERRWEERGESWSREVRVFYNLGINPAILYAPGWEYTWIEEPQEGGAPLWAPLSRAAMGYVTGFCVLEHDDHRLIWTEQDCGAETAETPRETWFRQQRDCLALPAD